MVPAVAQAPMRVAAKRRRRGEFCEQSSTNTNKHQHIDSPFHQTPIQTNLARRSPSFTSEFSWIAAIFFAIQRPAPLGIPLPGRPSLPTSIAPQASWLPPCS
jgi:hypothetical protein